MHVMEYCHRMNLITKCIPRDILSIENGKTIDTKHNHEEDV